MRLSIVLVWLGLTLLGAGLADAQPETDSSSPPLRATAFPTADVVESEYTDDDERLAALAILLDLLQFKTDDKSTLALERQTDYRRTIARLDPPRATDEQRAAARKLRRDPSFQSGVVMRFLPDYASEAARKAAVINPAQIGRNRSSPFWTELIAGLGVAALLTLLVAAIRKQRARRH